MVTCIFNFICTFFHFVLVHFYFLLSLTAYYFWRHFFFCKCENFLFNVIRFSYTTILWRKRLFILISFFSYTLYKGYLSERRVDVRWNNSHNHRGQLLWRITGGLWYNACLERGRNFNFELFSPIVLFLKLDLDCTVYFSTIRFIFS